MTARPEATDGAPFALRVPGWNEIPRLAHGFFGRHGGVSRGSFRSLNLSDAVGDESAAVADNWRRVGRALPGLAFVRMRQVHGARVVRAEERARGAEDADGMITRRAGVCLAILTADCVPLLCVAPAERAVMALHAGWRGTLAGIAAAGLDEAAELGIPPGAWRVALGPSIAGCCYEVEAEIGENLVDRWGIMPDAWQRSGAHGQLDLRAANRHILLSRGVPESHITTVGPCTACDSEDYFSHRRSGGRAGRQLSAIGWSSEFPVGGRRAVAAPDGGGAPLPPGWDAGGIRG